MQLRRFKLRHKYRLEGSTGCGLPRQDNDPFVVTFRIKRKFLCLTSVRKLKSPLHINPGMRRFGPPQYRAG
eukprot:1148607-Pelagomonas_calceolata.AAC.13